MESINLVGMFKMVVHMTKDDTYAQFRNPQKGICGFFQKDILTALLKINMYHLAPLLNIQDFVITNNELVAHIDTLFDSVKNLMMMSSEEEFCILNVNLKKTLLENEDSLKELLINFNCSEFCTIIMDHSSSEMKDFMSSVGKELKMFYTNGDFNKCLGVIMAVNNWCLDPCMFVTMVVFNAIYVAFIDYKKKKNGSVEVDKPLFDIGPYTFEDVEADDQVKERDVVYLSDKHIIMERILTTAVQQLLLDRSRDQIQLLNMLSASTEYNKFVHMDITIPAMENCLFKKISSLRCVKNVFTYLNIKKMKDREQSPQKIFDIWRNASAEQKLTIYSQASLDTDEERSYFPYVLTIHSAAHKRTTEFIRFTIQQVLQESEPELKKFIKSIFGNFNEFFDHCLFPDRENINKVIDDDVVVNINQFENGTFSLRNIIDKVLVVDKETLKYFIERIQHYSTKKYTKKSIIKIN